MDAEDVDGDGLPELFVTNFANEYSTLYQNFGNGIFLRQHGVLRPGVRLDALGQVGLRAGRLRQRRLAGLLLRQRARRQQRRAARPAGRLRGDPALVPQRSTASGSGWRPATPGRISTPSTSAGARPSATSTTTATSTSWSTTRTPPRPSSATTPSPRTTGSGSCSRGPRATATRSAPSSRSPQATGRFTASARGATACRRPTIPASWSGSARPPRSRKS